MYAGSFDPPSEGHKDIIKRASTLCDTLYVCVATNPEKKHPLFNTEERVDLVRCVTRELPNVETRTLNGLVVSFAEENNVDFLVRGLRAYRDFEPEFQMAIVNRKVSGIETVFLMASEDQTHVSSSLIRQLGVLGQSRLAHLHFVPPEIREQVYARLAAP